MASKKKKGNYICKSMVECLTCGKTIRNENQDLHTKISHNGTQVRYRFVTDAKQPRLQFVTLSNPKTGTDYNLNSGESEDPNSNSEVVDDPGDIVFGSVQEQESRPSVEMVDTSKEVDPIIATDLLDNAIDENLNIDDDHLNIPAGASESGLVKDSTGPNQPILEKYCPKLYGNDMRDFRAAWYKKLSLD